MPANSGSNVEILLAHRNAVLTSHKGEPDAEFEKELAQVVEEAALPIAFMGIVSESEKIEVVRIFGDVPREVGLRRGQRAVEVGDGFPLPVQPPRFELMNHDVAAPAMLNGRFGIPDAVLARGKFFQDREIVIPGDLCKHRFHNCFIRPGLTERGQSFHAGKSLLRSAACASGRPETVRNCRE